MLTYLKADVLINIKGNNIQTFESETEKSRISGIPSKLTFNKISCMIPNVLQSGCLK